MNSAEIRERFLEFFREQHHRVVPSSPLVLPNDPTLLFANAGMNQFKDVFTGRDRRDYTRAATVQKCLRVSGKHNDLEMVGRTPRHHTFFEMLGNFSFGDYFKRDAIELAWRLITDVYGVAPERLWVTVFAGTDDLPPDDEARELWREISGLPDERILGLGEKDNFWRMGDTGPCGPCSELHYDLGEALTSVDGPSSPATDDQRFLEIWNLVFMQFDQQAAGLERLPAPSIDTGMGLERIAAVLQDKLSNFETDLFVPLLEAAARRAGVRYGDDPDQDFSLRVIADHARAFACLVADGVVPANDKRGYVLRRLLRRAIRHGRKLGIDGPFLDSVTPVVLDGLGPVYPELLAARDAITEVGRLEEQRFAETLTTGLQLLEQALERIEPGSAGEPRTLSGSELFRLYDTFGFPLDLARDVAEERGIQLDEAGFEQEMAGQRARAQASWKGAAKREDAGTWARNAGSHRSTFVGYERTRVADVPVLALVRKGVSVDALETGDEGELLLEATPFYAEAGGQVADTGWIVGPAGRAEVVDVQRPLDGVQVHRARVTAGRIAVGEAVIAEIDESRRLAVCRNHTATHLLHAALREVVGTHVKQAGSLVASERLRFDFSHFAGLSDEALSDVEALANREILSDTAVTTEQTDIDTALGRGAMALFGEKYGDQVRIVEIGAFSLELCGGTHCARAGEIGLLKLTGERGVASGVRRIEAVSGSYSLERFRHAQRIVHALEEQLSVPGDQLIEEIERRLEQARGIQRELERERVGSVRERLAERVAKPDIAGGVRLLAERVDGLSAQETRVLADSLRQKLGSGVVVLGRADGAKAALLVAVTDDLKGRLPAGEIVRELSRIIGGGGGGRPDLAEAGGRAPERLDEALAAAKSAVGQRAERT